MSETMTQKQCVFVLSVLMPDAHLVGCFSTNENAEQYKSNHPATNWASYAEYETQMVYLDELLG